MKSQKSPEKRPLTKHPRVLVLILAGGQGSRLGPLTKHRAKPALPFAGSYRLIDFALSNCVHSHLSNVWIIEQFQPHSLNTHLTNGRPWDLDRMHGGLQILPPHQSNLHNDDLEGGGHHGDGGWNQGNADALYRNRRFIREFAPDLVLVLSADAVYRYDYRDLIDAHLEREAELTLLTTQVAAKEATRFGNVVVNRRGRVTDFRYKPEKPISEHVTTEVFLYDAPVLLQVLEALGERAQQSLQQKKSDAASEDAEIVALNDFGHELLPELVQREKTYALELNGELGDYWRDVGTLGSYWDSQMQFLHAPPFALDDARWPILTRGEVLLPARIEAGRVENSLLSPGSRVAGTVENCIIAPRVTVETGAHIENSIVLHGATITKNARIKNVIVDEETVVEGEHRGRKNHIVIVERQI